jgi:hypothetical protein
MIGTQHVVEAGEGVVLNLAGPLMFPQRPQDHAEVRGCAQCVDVVLAEETRERCACRTS